MVLVAGLSLAAAPAAHAAPPTITKPAAFSVDIPFPDVCDFPMTATVRGRTLGITFVDGQGATIRGFAGGQLFVTWTRDDGLLSRTFVISGPTFSDANGVAVHGTGRWTTPVAGTGWALVIGNLTFDGYQDGFSLVVSHTGPATSICDLMAA